MADKNRIEKLLSQLSQLTSVPGEITRQTFSSAWEGAVCLLSEQMRKLGMHTRIDGFGNLIGVYNPENSKEKPIGIGSHVDTVINGGAYDGAIGIVAGLEMVHMLDENAVFPPRPIEIIAFAEEEGGVFGKGCMGSEYITGNTPLEKLEQFFDREGITARQRAGRTGLKKAEYGSDFGWGRDHYHAFFEIHAEQGAFLQELGKKIGIVEGVVGILRSKVTFTGQANHAGTTLMNRRKDAMVALSDFIGRAYRYGLSNNGQLVVTNGKISVFPNQHNVVPGKASSVIELRGESDDMIQQAFQQLKKIAYSVAAQYGVDISFSEPVYVKPIRFDERLLAVQSKVAAGDDAVVPIFSWAGHDAKLMAKVAPSTMIFVPSKDGLSHCPEEYSDPADVASAVDFLFNVLMEMQ